MGRTPPTRVRATASRESIERQIRPAGFYRTKASRLKALARFLVDRGGVRALEALPTDALRQALLSLEGIGPETADAICLYAFERPVVVIDAYLRRLCSRILGASKAPSDDQVRASVATAITATSDLNEFHALVVAHGKTICAARPRCADCVLRRCCRTGAAESNP